MITAQRLKLPSCMCLFHPDEPIIRVCVNANCKSSSISCAECAIRQSSKCSIEHTDQLLTLQKFVNYVSNFHSNTDSSVLLQPLISLVSKENDTLFDTKQKMDIFKKALKDTIAKLIADITKQFFTFETEISNELDQQLTLIKQNFQSCTEFLQSNSLEKENDKNATLLLNFGEIVDVKELASLVTQIRTELMNQKDKYEPVNLKNNLSNVAGSLENSLINSAIYQQNVLKSLQVQADMLIASTIPNFLQTIKKSSDHEKIILIPKEEFSLPSSTILKNEHIALFKQWIPKKITKLDLLYRGSRDGFTAYAFHKNCDNKGPTITVIVSQAYGKIFGGYTEASWNATGTEKKDNDSFLFSLSTSEKFNHKSGAGIFCHSGGLSCFGGCLGPDLSISNNCNIQTPNRADIGTYFSLPKGYSSVKEAKTYLAGEATFGVQEIEVFQIILGSPLR